MILRDALSLTLALCALACGPTTPASTTPTAPAPTTPIPAASSAPAKPAPAGAACRPIHPDEPKAFVRRMVQALEKGDQATWDRMQSARYSANPDEGLRSMRFDAWKSAMLARSGELNAAPCRVDSQDTILICETSKPLKFAIVREGCEIKLNDN